METWAPNQSSEGEQKERGGEFSHYSWGGLGARAEDGAEEPAEGWEFSNKAQHAAAMATSRESSQLNPRLSQKEEGVIQTAPSSPRGAGV